MTDSLEARRAALVENLTRLGYTQTDRVEYGQWWDGATSDGGVLVLNADKLDSPDADHTMVRAERYIAPLLAIEAAAFARGVESRPPVVVNKPKTGGHNPGPPVDVEAALDEWARKTLRYAMNVGREDFGSPTRAELLDLLRTVTTPREPLTLAQLEALPLRSVVIDNFGDAWQSFITEGGLIHWCFDGICEWANDLMDGGGPLHLLHTGTVTTRED